jgi:pterin-4a-carbinolamine dehydratase
MSIKLLMKDYFDESEKRILSESIGLSIVATRDIPVVPRKADNWEIVTSPNRMKKEFEFESFEKMSFFINEILNYQEEVNHHAKLMIDHRKVIIEVYTHDVDDVTELDKEYAQMADDIYDDVQYINTTLDSGEKVEYTFG